jgi:hypothetical protein
MGSLLLKYLLKRTAEAVVITIGKTIINKKNRK